MKYRRLDNNGDYIFGQNKYGFLSDLEAISQAIGTKLKLLYGEWWEDKESGFPLFEKVLQQKNTESGKNTIDLLVRDTISGVDGVLKIPSLTSVYSDDGTYSISATVDTIYGQAYLNSISLGVS